MSVYNHSRNYQLFDPDLDPVKQLTMKDGHIQPPGSPESPTFKPFTEYTEHCFFTNHLKPLTNTPEPPKVRKAPKIHKRKQLRLDFRQIYSFSYIFRFIYLVDIELVMSIAMFCQIKKKCISFYISTKSWLNTFVNNQNWVLPRTYPGKRLWDFVRLKRSWKVWLQ